MIIRKLSADYKLYPLLGIYIYSAMTYFYDLIVFKNFND
jgi:hypothetical protein